MKTLMTLTALASLTLLASSPLKASGSDPNLAPAPSIAAASPNQTEAATWGHGGGKDCCRGHANHAKLNTVTTSRTALEESRRDPRGGER